MTLEVFRSDPHTCAAHETGFFDLSARVRMTILPVWDHRTDLAARLGHGVAETLLKPLGLRLPTVDEYEELHRQAFHIEPYTLPTREMVHHEGIVTQAGEQLYRQQHMMGLGWCRLHDEEVWKRLAGWDRSQPVANFGKHWAQHGTIVGWWTAHARAYGVHNDRMIQEPSRFHAADPTYCDYGTNFHACEDVA